MENFTLARGNTTENYGNIGEIWVTYEAFVNESESGMWPGRFQTETPRTAVKRMQDFNEYHWAIWLIKFLVPVIVFAGTLGNGLEFYVLTRKEMRNTSVNLYLAVMSCADTIVLYFSAFKTWLRVVNGYEFLHASTFTCKLTMFLFVFSLHVSAWCILLVTFDRFVIVWLPFKATSFCSYRRSRLMAVGMTSLAAIYNLHLFWTMHLQEISTRKQVIKQCAPLPSDKFMNGPFNYLKLGTYSIVPFALVMTMNAFIIWRICHPTRGVSSSHNRKLRSGGSFRDREDSPRQHVTAMLLLVSFTWLVLTLPFTVISLLPFTYPDMHSRATVFLAKTCCFVLLYLNHAVNFLLYCIAGRRFRTELQRRLASARSQVLVFPLVSGILRRLGTHNVMEQAQRYNPNVHVVGVSSVKLSNEEAL